MDRHTSSSMWASLRYALTVLWEDSYRRGPQAVTDAQFCGTLEAQIYRATGRRARVTLLLGNGE